MSTRSESYEVVSSPAGSRPTGLVRGGWACAAGSAVAVAGVVVTLLVDPSVPETQYSYPFSANAFRFTEVIWTLTHLLVFVGVLALARSVLVGGGRLPRVGRALAVAGAALLVPAELGLVLLATTREGTTAALTGDTVIGLAATVYGAGLALLAAAVRRDGSWPGWGGWVLWPAGLFVLLPVVLGGISPSSFLWGIAALNLASLALGLAMIGEGRRRG